MNNHEDSNEVGSNMEGVPYSNVPFPHLGNFNPEQVVNMQNTDWTSNLNPSSVMKQDNGNHMVGAGMDENGMDDEYNIEQDLNLKNLVGDHAGSPTYLNDRQRIQIHNQLSWEEAVKQDVLIVRCRDTTAELHKSRLGSGSKGKCIKVGDQWFTPTEFETRSGRGSSKDWKRSIRFGGHTLQKLIEEGILAPHAISCTCSICCGDSTLTGPVRLFQPYRRKRRDMDNSRSVSIDRSRRSLDINQSNSMNQIAMMQNSTYSFDHVDEILNLTLSASQQLKMAWDQVKLQTEAIREAAITHVRAQAEMEKREALSQQRMEVVSILKRILPPEQEPLMQQLIAQMHMDNMPSAKSCANCGRDAFLECTACRRSCYCSTFCQQKDWPQHQHTCEVLPSDELHHETMNE